MSIEQDHSVGLLYIIQKHLEGLGLRLTHPKNGDELDEHDHGFTPKEPPPINRPVDPPSPLSEEAQQQLQH